MYKFLLVLVALFACVFAAQDQEAAEQYFLRYGSYPSWYNNYAYSAYPAAATYSAALPAATTYSAGYPYAYSAGYPYAYSGYSAAAYPYSGLGYKYVY